MKILITGDCGFVGRAFRRRLVRENHEIIGVDIVNGVDARDFFRVNQEPFDLVIHLAAIVGGRAQIEGRPLSLGVNLSIDAELFAWARKTKPGRVVYFSSSAAYPVSHQSAGSVDRLIEYNINFKDIWTPDSSYGWAKLTGEMLASLAIEEGQKVSVVRPFSGYGTDQSLDYPFPSFIRRAVHRESPFQIWGDGTQVRDWIHINDIVDAVLKMVELDMDGPVNLCTGRPTSFVELAQAVCQEVGYSPDIEKLTSMPSGVHYRVGNPSRMNRFFQPRITLEEGIRMAIRNVL